MSFYNELQLGAADFKALIASKTRFRDKALHSLIFALKVILTVAFAFLVVSAFAVLFGSDNSAVGVICVLSVMSFQKVDLDVGNRSALAIFPTLFLILAVGPKCANLAGPLAGAAVNVFCIFMILLLSCHRVEYMNHFIFVLGYLLLYGYDVSGGDYLMRIFSLAACAAFTMLVYIRNHRGFASGRRIFDLFLDFDLRTERTQWQTASAVLIAAALMIPELLGLPRTMWIGFAVMSVCFPFKRNIGKRAAGRILGTCAGLFLFIILDILLPDTLLPYFGIIGGIGVGFSVRYGIQTMFNVLGALSVAVPLHGAEAALSLRALYNVAGAVFVLVMVCALGLLKKKFARRQEQIR